VTKTGAGDVGSQDEAHRPAQAREDVGSVLHHPLRRGVSSGEGLGDGSGVSRGEGRALHEAVHEEAVALVGGDPSGARVRVVEIAEGLQVRHDVAHRGRGEGPPQGPGEVLRSHRLAGLDVQLDERPEYLPPAIVKGGRAHTSIGKLYGAKEKRQRGGGWETGIRLLRRRVSGRRLRGSCRCSP
jgi:hypothetical protein